MAFGKKKDQILIKGLGEVVEVDRLRYPLSLQEIYALMLFTNDVKLKEYAEVLETHEDKLNFLISMVSRIYRDRELFVKDKEEIATSSSQTRVEILKQARQYVKDIRDNFEIMEYRLTAVMRLKECCRNLWRVARNENNKYFKQIAMILHDSLSKMRAEEITIDQLEAIDSILNILIKETVTLNDAKIVDDILVKNDMEYIPEAKEDTQVPTLI